MLPPINVQKRNPHIFETAHLSSNEDRHAAIQVLAQKPQNERNARILVETDPRHQEFYDDDGIDLEGSQIEEEQKNGFNKSKMFNRVVRGNVLD